MKIQLTVLVLIISVTLLRAQEAAVKLSSKRLDDKSVEINYEKTDPGSMTVQLKFRSLENSNSNRSVFTAEGYAGVLTILKPVNRDQNISYSYVSRAIRGKLNPKVDRDFVYMLPYPNGTEVNVGEANFVGAKYFGNTEPSDWKVYQFSTATEQPVLAVRKGIVVEVMNAFDDSELDGASYTSKNNRIIVEHTDGTIATYGNLKREGISVKVGDLVFPGQEIARNLNRGEKSFRIIFSVTYLKSGDLYQNQDRNITNSESYYGWITPNFLTSAGLQVLKRNEKYQSAISDEIITHEMSKRELRKFKR